MEWPLESIPDDVFQDEADLLESADGRRIAIRAISRGEPFLKSKVSGFGEKPTLSRKVAIDMRAFSIRINDVSGVAGFLLPGDRVDVLLTRTLTGAKNLITDIILQNVSILGIDQESNEEGSNPVLARTATIEVAPVDAQKLALAQQIGTLSLTLRNYADVEDTSVKRVSVSSLSTARKANSPALDNRVSVRVRKGGKTTTQRVRKE
jgi:pilus assembly protein CpaB